MRFIALFNDNANLLWFCFALYNIIIYNYSNVSYLLFLGSKETLEHNFTYMYSIKRICSYAF